MYSGSIAELEDVRLHYRFEEASNGSGSAPVLVLSHALGANLSMWDPQVAELRDDFRILRYDARGHGGSSVPSGDYTLSDLGGDVLDLMDYLDIEKAHFCGISMGGITALWLGIHAPERFHSIIAADSAARIGTLASWTERIAIVRKGGLEAIVDGTVERWYTDAYRHRKPEKADATKRMILQTPVDGYLSCCAALRDADLTAAVGSVSARTLVMSGKHDPVTPPPQGKFLVEQISGSRYVELNAAHLANVEDAGGFDAALLSFIADGSQPEEDR